MRRSLSRRFENRHRDGQLEYALEYSEGCCQSSPPSTKGAGGIFTRLAEKLEVHYTPKHGSWLDIAEIELSVLARQCLHQRIGSLEELKELLKIWKKQRNAESHTISWRFKTEDARIKLRRLYPVLSSEE